MNKKYFLSFVCLLAACIGRQADLITSQPVNYFEHSDPPPGVPGNVRIGTLPAGVRLHIVQAQYKKDYAVYEIEDTVSGEKPVKAYVFSGTGVDIVDRAGK